jgi:hypothetical protein
MLATITGAVAASRLGIAGTIIGAAFMSLAGTVGAAIYKHYLGRSKERLRAAAVNLAPRASANAVAAATARRQQADDQHGAGTVTGETSATQASSTRASTARTARTGTVPGWVAPDSAETQIIGGGADYPGTAAGLAPAEETEVFSLDDDFDRTWFRDSTVKRPASTSIAAGSSGHGTVSGARHATASGGPGTAGGPGNGTGGRTARGTTAAGPASSGEDGQPDRTWHGIRKRWLAVAALTLGAFVIAMGSITAFEAIAGKPLQSVVWHRSGSGTTIGGLVGSHSPGHEHGSRPGGSPTPTSPASSPASSHPASTPPASPTSPVSPTPTPSSSPSPSPSGSSGLNGSLPASPGGTPDPDASPTDSAPTR